MIALNAVLIGAETSTTLMSRHGEWLHRLNWVFQAFFVFEIAVRLAAEAPSVMRFFRNGWNVFDFAIVSLSLVPAVGEFATVARLARLLRVVRLVSVSDELRLIVETMLKSVRSMGYITALVGLLMYVYAVAGVHFFRASDPEHWGTLGSAFLSLFEIMTLEGWNDMLAVVLPAQPWAWIFFVSYIVLAVFVLINLFIAVVINNMDTLKKSEAANERP